MRYKKLNFIAFSLFVVLSVLGCSDNNDNNNNGSSSIQLRLIDAPGDYLKVNVNIIDIRYNQSDGEGGWQSFGDPDDYPIEVDLTELIAGNDLILVDEIIPSGDLKQIRLVLGEGNTLVIEDDNGDPVTVPLSTPSAQQSGLKLHFDTVLEPGFSYVYILDWDVNESIVEAGNSGNYILKPVINVIAEVNSGSISGTVMDDMMPISNATVQVFTTSDEYVTSTMTNELGDFIAAGLSEADFILKIDASGYEPYESPEPINVLIGEVTDVGEIILIHL